MAKESIKGVTGEKDMETIMKAVRDEVELRESKKLKDDEVIIQGKKVKIKPVKVRYLIGERDYLNYTILEKEGLVEALKYENGLEILKLTLNAIFDDMAYVDSIVEDLDSELLENIIKISKRVSKVKDEEEELKNVMEALEGGMELV